MQNIKIFAALLISYLIGSIPFGFCLVKLTIGKDLRLVESGRTGGTNTMRAAGLLPGLITAVLDVGKGVVTGWIANWLLPGDVWLQIFTALLAIVGHNYSIYLPERNESGKIRLRGGAGGATSFGGAIALWPQSGLIILPLILLIYLLVGYASVTTISIPLLATLIFTYRAWIGVSPWVYILYGVMAELIVLWALRPNLKRLRLGSERIVGLRAYLLKKKIARQSIPNS